MHTTARAPSVERNAPVARRTSAIYIVTVLVMTGIVLGGFWPFYSALPTGGTGTHWAIYLHAAVFSGWMILLFTQVVLTFRGRIRMHQRLGRFGIGYGVVVLLMGLVISIVAPVLQVKDGRAPLDAAAGFLILPLGDMLLFAGFFSAGVAYRRKKELHKRLMVLATIALLFAPAARLGGDAGPFAMLGIWLLPLGILIAHDALARRRVERVYVLGIVVLLVAFARVGLMESEIWLPVGRRLLTAFLPAAAE